MRYGDDIARVGIDGIDSWALTASGKKMKFFDPRVDAICFSDIARCLSRLCRFTGATSQFYSVAQHSVLVAALVKEVLDDDGDDDQTVEYWDQILAALFHDAEEAYTNDLNGPLKSSMGGRYRWIASGILRKIYDKFDIDWGYHNFLVKDADNKAIVIERFHLMPDHPEWPKVDPEEMGYPKPRSLEHDEARMDYVFAVELALRIRNALRFDEAA